MAALEVVVDQAHRLHEGVDRRGPDEAPAAPLQVLRQRDRLGRLARAARGRPPVGLEAPDVRGERALLLDQLDGAPGVVDRRLDLAAVADDPGVGEQALDVVVAEAGDRVGRSRRRRCGTPRACAGSSATRARTGSPRGRASRTAAGRRRPGSPTRRRGRRGSRRRVAPGAPHDAVVAADDAAHGISGVAAARGSRTESSALRCSCALNWSVRAITAAWSPRTSNTGARYRRRERALPCRRDGGVLCRHDHCAGRVEAGDPGGGVVAAELMAGFGDVDRVAAGELRGHPVPDLRLREPPARMSGRHSAAGRSPIASRRTPIVRQNVLHARVAPVDAVAPRTNAADPWGGGGRAAGRSARPSSSRPPAPGGISELREHRRGVVGAVGQRNGSAERSPRPWPRWSRASTR